MSRMGVTHNMLLTRQGLKRSAGIKRVGNMPHTGRMVGAMETESNAVNCLAARRGETEGGGFQKGCQRVEATGAMLQDSVLGSKTICTFPDRNSART